MEKKRSQWASGIGFILAAAGSAVGVGNIWKFPGKVGAYGGGVFLLTYFIVVLVLGLVVMLGELSLGRFTQKNVVGAFAAINKRWKFVGYLSVVNPYVILSYYSVVGGWVMKYIFVYLFGGNFGGGETQYQDYFLGFIAKPIEPVLWTAFFLGLCVLVILKGVTGGIEKVSKLLMPIFFLLIIGVVIRSVTLPGAEKGLKFMLTIDPSLFTRDTVIIAIGQAFYSLSLGMSIMITYGSYLPKSENMVKSSAWVCVLDTLVATLAAFAIVPVVYATLGAEGLGMGGLFAFIALPNVFASIPGGVIVGLVFFVLLFVAALTSAISLMEGCISFASEEFKITRNKAVLILTPPLLIMGALYSFSQGAFDLKMPWFDFANGFQMKSLGTVMELFTDNLMVPLNAFLTCLFVGWIWGAKKAADEIEHGLGKPFKLRKIWIFCVRYIAPIVVFIILYLTFVRGMALS